MQFFLFHTHYSTDTSGMKGYNVFYCRNPLWVIQRYDSVGWCCHQNIIHNCLRVD